MLKVFTFIVTKYLMISRRSFVWHKVCNRATFWFSRLSKHLTADSWPSMAAQKRAVSPSASLSSSLAPLVNYTNIERAAFCAKLFCAAFMCLQFGFVIFSQNRRKSCSSNLGEIVTSAQKFLQNCHISTFGSIHQSSLSIDVKNIWICAMLKQMQGHKIILVLYCKMKWSVS